MAVCVSVRVLCALCLMVLCCMCVSVSVPVSVPVFMCLYEVLRPIRVFV